MVEALGGFDPQATYDAASLEYEDASRDFWQYLSLRTVDRLQLQPGEHVLDVPCGTGPSLIAAAERVGASGRVVGIDQADQMLSIARAKVAERGLQNVAIHFGDMTAIEAPEHPYDAVVCVLGVFFADDMPGLLSSLFDLVRPGGGRLAVTVFGERSFHPMRDVFVDAVAEVAPGLAVIQPWTRTAEAEVFRGIFDAAGLVDVAIETRVDTLPLPSADDWWRIAKGSGLRRALMALGDDPAARVRARCDAYIDAHGLDHLVTTSRYAVVTRS